MKNLNKLMITGFSGFLLMTCTACINSEAAQSQEVDLKKNEQLKERVFQQILNDEELFTEFTGKMRENRQAMEWMRENRPLMQRFYSGSDMRDMMRRHPEMRQPMMQNMIEMMDRDTARTKQDTLMRNMEDKMRQQIMEEVARMMEGDTMMQNRMRHMMQRQHMRNSNDNKNK